jgi:hypothetical protein
MYLLKVLRKISPLNQPFPRWRAPQGTHWRRRLKCVLSRADKFGFLYRYNPTRSYFCSQVWAPFSRQTTAGSRDAMGTRVHLSAPCPRPLHGIYTLDYVVEECRAARACVSWCIGHAAAYVAVDEKLSDQLKCPWSIGALLRLPSRSGAFESTSRNSIIKPAGVIAAMHIVVSERCGMRAPAAPHARAERAPEILLRGFVQHTAVMPLPPRNSCLGIRARHTSCTATSDIRCSAAALGPARAARKV